LEARLSLKISETFQETLVCQYRDLIHEAILESETDHKTRMDLGKLNSKLRVIYKAAQYDGLTDDIINRLIDEAIPATKAA
jgi:prophage maintenance system killer protein